MPDLVADANIETEPRTELRGAELIRRLVANLPNEPGVYRMLDEKGEPLYVGKAKSLRKRVVTYTKRRPCRRGCSA